MTLSEEYKNQAVWRNWDTYIEKLPIQNQDTIIDIGCSIGLVSNILANKSSQVIGIDINPELLSEAIKSYSADNIIYKLMDAKSLNGNDLPKVDGIWTSFLPAYIPDFYPVLKKWLQFLKPNGWIALVEMSDLFGHEPLDKSSQDIFKKYYTMQLNKKLYDFEMGSKLKNIIKKCGLSIIHDENKYDLELTFNGPANSDILLAWESRFERMSLFKKFVGEIKFQKIKNDFKSCLLNNNHSARTIIKFVIARKNKY